MKFLHTEDTYSGERRYVLVIDRSDLLDLDLIDKAAIRFYERHGSIGAKLSALALMAYAIEAAEERARAKIKELPPLWGGG